MAVRVGINGFGRIGRLVFRAMAAAPEEFDVVAINDLSDAKHLALLLKYDSVHGRFKGTVEVAEGGLVVNGKHVKITTERDPANLLPGSPPAAGGGESGLRHLHWQQASLQKHIDAGAEPRDPLRPGQGQARRDRRDGRQRPHHQPSDRILSNASCTTNCLAPMAKVLHESFGIVKGLMTTIHAYTNDQRVADQVHSDPYRARAAAVNIIPSSTGIGLPRRGDPRPERQAHRLRPSRAGSRWVGYRPDVARSPRMSPRTRSTPRSRPLPEGPLWGSSSTRPTRWSPAGDHRQLPTRASLQERPAPTVIGGAAWSRPSPGTTTSGATPSGPPS